MIETHLHNVADVGIAYDEISNRVWVCINGTSVLRVKLAKKADGEPYLMIEDHTEDVIGD
ncbi:hypothetical protein UFOVP1244_139 [uncultured Caudovirales phage]|uniref:Uncharacterized protein n=1 Tax=uncultured Caudovirales phage TaxID=2100421 RepID=A0A6J5RAY1_9CAUD|nr:hypothetical protein UFOVP1244_139 [uncultured Caudovirales phage]